MGIRGNLDIDVVVIGRNAGRYLEATVKSVLASTYVRGRIHIYYVDMGSTDGTFALLGSFPRITATEIKGPSPTRGRARNAGWRMGESKWVQFLDAGAILAPDWFDAALAAKGRKVAGLYGVRKELTAQMNDFNLIEEIQTTPPELPEGYFPGEALMRRAALEKTGGWNEAMPGGEDLEFTRRIGRRGWTVRYVREPMCGHDAPLTSVAGYVAREFVRGYGLAAAGLGHLEPLALARLGRVCLWGGAAVVCGLLGLAGMMPFMGLAVCLLVLPRAMQVGSLQSELDISEAAARLYAWHKSLSVVPGFFGVLRYVFGRLAGLPLRPGPGPVGRMVDRSVDWIIEKWDHIRGNSA